MYLFAFVLVFCFYGRGDSLEVQEDYLDGVQGMPTTFAYHAPKILVASLGKDDLARCLKGF